MINNMFGIAYPIQVLIQTQAKTLTKPMTFREVAW
jgi:hypothetical protein